MSIVVDHNLKLRGKETDEPDLFTVVIGRFLRFLRENAGLYMDYLYPIHLA
jgi:hypothetical protein